MKKYRKGDLLKAHFEGINPSRTSINVKIIKFNYREMKERQANLRVAFSDATTFLEQDMIYKEMHDLQNAIYELENRYDFLRR